jgi:hypothetical protein
MYKVSEAPPLLSFVAGGLVGFGLALPIFPPPLAPHWGTVSEIVTALATVGIGIAGLLINQRLQREQDRRRRVAAEVYRFRLERHLREWLDQLGTLEFQLKESKTKWLEGVLVQLSFEQGRWTKFDRDLLNDDRLADVDMDGAAALNRIPDLLETMSGHLSGKHHRGLPRLSRDPENYKDGTTVPREYVQKLPQTQEAVANLAAMVRLALGRLEQTGAHGTT